MVDALKGDIDFDELKRQLLSFNSVTVTTNTISGNSTELFKTLESEDIVSSVSKAPDEREFPEFGRVMVVRVNILSGSTDTTLSLYESKTGDEIDQTFEITKLDVSDSPESFVLEGGFGLPFVNEDGEKAFNVEIDELSGNDSEYELKIVWSSVNTQDLGVGAF